MSVHNPQDMVSLMRLLRRLVNSQSGLGTLLARLSGPFNTWAADDFSKFTNSGSLPSGVHVQDATAPPAMLPIQAPEAISIAPGTFELRFTRLQQEGAYDDMWDLIAEDARRAWGGRGRFVDRMSRQNQHGQVIGAKVEGVDILDRWTDAERGRTYRNVAKVSVRYLIRDGWRELEVDRRVHLIPAAGGWRTLYYPVGD